MATIILPRNVHFVYEHALAHLELRDAFGLDLEWDVLDPWRLNASLDGSEQVILERAAYVGEIDGSQSVYSQLIRPAYQGGRYNRTRSENQYLTHWIYPYKGKFHPQMIRGILNSIRAERGWKVADVFSGSGTTLLECQLLGVHSVGVEISPLCVLLTRVKTESWLAAEKIGEAVDDLLARDNLDPRETAASEWEPQEVANFVEIARMVTFSDMSRRGRDPEKYFRKNLLAMLRSVSDMAKAIDDFGISPGDVEILQGDSRDLRAVGLEAQSIDAVVTSPPYSVALDYVANDEHALTALGYDVDELRQSFIGVRGNGMKERLALYERDMRDALAEMARVLKPGAPAVIVIGNITFGGQESLTTDDIVQWAESAGMRFEREMPKIVWGLYNVVKDEKILFLRRGAY